MWRNILQLSLTLFLLLDSIGNIPLYMSLLYGIKKKDQVRIIIREMIIALFIIFVFYFGGEALLFFLKISQSTVQVAGGIILFLIAFKMVFPPAERVAPGQDTDLKKITEPFIVPLAIPLVAGPAVLAAVIIYSHEAVLWEGLGAILIAWFISLIVLLTAPYIQEKLGKRGVSAIEKLMGLILILMASEMFLTGIKTFMIAKNLS